jgi:hypothetical protein
METSFIKDFTPFFRDLVDKEYRHAALIFNNSILRLQGDYYLIAARVHVPESYKLIKHAELPIMWGSIGNIHDNWTYASGPVKLGYTIVALVKTDTNFTHLEYVDHANIFAEGNTHAAEDPRLYIKADGTVCVYTIGKDKPCKFGKSEWKMCSYLSEYGILIEKGKILISNARKIPCLIGAVDYASQYDKKPDGSWDLKNLSPWVYNGVNYWTDFYPSNTIYQETGDQICKRPMEPQMKLTEIAKMKEYMTFNLNLLRDTVKFYAFSGTTPSIPITPEIAKQFGFSGDVYAGVAHIRMGMLPLFRDMGLGATSNEIFDCIKSEMESEYEFFGSYIEFLEKFKTYTDADEMYWVLGDVYAMCVYFFDPSVSKNKTLGDIIATTNVFMPMALNIDGSLCTRTPVVFPTGLMFEGSNIIISYGEGDIKTKLMKCDISRLGFAEYNNAYCSNLKFKVLELPSNGNEKRKVSDLIKIFS